MRYVIPFIFMITLPSCQWALTHPQEDVEIGKLIEEVAEEAFRYETGKLTPGTPPLK